MSRALLNPKAAERLVQLCGMFGSDHDGERAAAAKLADEHVKRLGLTWGNVILGAEGKATHWLAMARHCQDNTDLFSPRERAFIANMARGRYPPSDKQLAWLEMLHDRLQSEAAA